MNLKHVAFFCTIVNNVVLLTSQRSQNDYCRLVYSRAAIALKSTFKLLYEASRLHDLSLVGQAQNSISLIIFPTPLAIEMPG